MMDYAIRFDGVYKSFSQHASVVLSDLSFTWPKEHLICLLGSSGSGKTTILRLIAGLEVPDSGRITLSGKIATEDGSLILAPHERQVGFIFQDLALWPHMTVRENIAFGLKLKRVQDADAIIEPLTDFLGITQLLQRYPHELSGGQQQLVAIARSIVLRPKILLMDEPMANLDVKLRHKLRQRIKSLVKELGITVVYVTHDHHEALRLGDYVAILDRGRIVEFDTPHGILASASPFVKEFIEIDSI